MREVSPRTVLARVRSFGGHPLTKLDTSSPTPAAIISIPLLPAAGAGAPTRRPHVTGMIQGKAKGLCWMLLFEKSPSDV